MSTATRPSRGLSVLCPLPYGTALSCFAVPMPVDPIIVSELVLASPRSTHCIPHSDSPAWPCPLERQYQIHSLLLRPMRIGFVYFAGLAHGERDRVKPAPADQRGNPPAPARAAACAGWRGTAAKTGGRHRHGRAAPPARRRRADRLPQ